MTFLSQIDYFSKDIRFTNLLFSYLFILWDLHDVKEKLSEVELMFLFFPGKWEGKCNENV